MMLFSGEVAAVKTVLAVGEQYGYGNLIAHLKRAWALRLMQSNPNLAYAQALLATEPDAYPEEFGIDEMARLRIAPEQTQEPRAS